MPFGCCRLIWGLFVAADFCLQVLQVGVFGLQITPPSFGSHFTLVTYLFLDELYIHIFFLLLGRLHKYCRAPNMPQETCFMGCKPCIEYSGVWCPKGHVVVWINGVR